MLVTKDSTNVSVVIRIVDSTDGTPETGVEHNTSGIDLWYRREGAAVSSITEVALAALTTAHTDGGIEHISHGYYRLDVPDAAFATGVDGVQIGGTVTGMVVFGPYVQLTDVDLFDGVRGGMTALPNAAADAAGGLPISDAGGLDLDALNSNVSAILTDTGTTLDNLVDDLETRLGTPGDLGSGATVAANLADMAGATFSNSTDSLEAIRNKETDIETDTAEIGAAGAGLTAVPWNAAWDAEVQSEVNDALIVLGLDHLVSTSVAGTDIADNSILAKLVSSSATADWDDFVNTTDSLQAIRDFVAGLNNISAAQVNAELLDVLGTDTQSLPGQAAPTATPTLTQAIMYLYKNWRNKKEQTSTTFSLYDDAGTTVDQKATVSDDGTTATKGEIASGP